MDHKLFKQSETVALENEKRFRALIERSPDMETLTTSDGTLLYGSPSVTRILGYSPDEFLNTSILDYIHPDDKPAFLEGRMQIIDIPGRYFSFKQRCLHKNGNWIWCEGTVTNLLEESAVNAIVSNFRDISEKKAIEDQLEYDRNNLNALISNTDDLIWSVSKDFKLITSNTLFNQVVKRASGEEMLKGDDVLDTKFPAEIIHDFKKWYERGFSGEVFTTVLHQQEDEDKWIEISFHPIRNGEETVGTACRAHDITERKKAEASLIHSEERLREAEAIANLGNWEIDLAKQVHYWSDGVYSLFGVNKGDVEPCEKEFMAFFHPDDLAPSYEIINRGFEALENVCFDFRYIRKDGSVRHGYNEWKFKFDAAGAPTHLLGIFQDVTERRLAEIERIKIVNDLALRNKELEQFTYIISHNLRAPVANILGVSNALKSPGLNDDDKEMLGKGLNDSVLRLDGVVKDLNEILQVKAELNERKGKMIFSELVENIQNSVSNLLAGETIHIHSDFSEIDEFVTLKSYMYSIFYNLILNSIKYRRKEVETTIDVKSLLEKDKVILVFTDNGMGFDMEKKADKVFGLYKRFHPEIEGKGMGLFMVKNQVESLGGKIDFVSEIGIGTQFTIELAT